VTPLPGPLPPFSPYLSSIDPLGIYPASSGAASVRASWYETPYLSSAERMLLEAFLAERAVVDPLNLVLWGSATLDRLVSLTASLQRWVPTLASSPQWGLTQEHGVRVRLPRMYSLQNTRVNARFKPMLILTQVINTVARHHVRIMTPFEAGGGWGTVALAGAHTETLGRTGRWLPPLWHRVEDWHVARDMLRSDLASIVGGSFVERRRFPTEGVWQRKPFDGRVYFVRV